GCTDNHPFWSVDRQDFIPAGELIEGERLLLYNGESKRVVQKLPRPGPQVVYNLEIYGEHVYHVTADGVLVHNDCKYEKFERYVSEDEASASFNNQRLVFTRGHNQKFKIIADYGTVNPKSLGEYEFYEYRLTIIATPGAHEWLETRRIKHPLGHSEQTWQMSKQELQEFNTFIKKILVEKRVPGNVRKRKK
ncbi:MAG: hypothetical protein IJM54_02505, partial [Thermoguttaceae bacterium]|nr:hypothetical protein [Thermoguttaceae bacterium]